MEGRYAAAWATINTITGRKHPQKYNISACTDSPQELVNQSRDQFKQLLTTADPFIHQSVTAEELDIDTSSITVSAAELQLAAHAL